MSKIIELRAENFLNLKAIEIKADGKSVTLTGANEAGKTAVLNAIFTALTGKALEDPIRRGEERAEVEVTLEHLVVRRVWTAKSGSSGSVVVESLPDKEGKSARYSSPQTLLNELLGRLSFNPIEFAQLGRTAEGRRDQRRTLMDIAKIDLGAIETKRTELVDSRAAANREAKRLQAVLDSSSKPEEGLPAMEASLEEQLQKISGLENTRGAHESYKKEIANIDYEIGREENRILSCEGSIREAKKVIQENEAQIEEYRKRIAERQKAKLEIKEPATVSDQDLAAAKQELSGLDAKNRKVRAAAQYQETKKLLEDACAEAAQLDSEVQKLDEEKRGRIAGATYPVPGLSVDDECVLYEGIPLSQQSTGCQIRVSTAIAMALNPKLRVILLRDASLLDSAGMSEITKMAEEKDYQLFIEKVDETGKVGIFIEAGEIRSVDGQQVEKKEE